ncbi:MAG TPA: RNA degradosome polyphosphate kinase, partial [Solirubrobacterales bacterium]|nr:RNA degradosome polyphosphate kinase [Solirubrobacterales bacterium]
LMPRNLDSRVELVVPVEEEEPRGEILDVLERSLADNTNSWELGPDGEWTRLVAPEGERRSVQEELRERYGARRGEQLAPASS